MDANPRTEVTCSHTPAFVVAKGHTRSVHLNQNGEKSSSGNFFRRLDQEADLRDTLNRRPDHEQSQQSIAHNMHLEVAPRGQAKISIEELCRVIAAMKENDVELIAAAIGSPFNVEIREARLLEEFKLPAIKAYKGKFDPQDHLDHFNNLMELHLVSKLAKCRVLSSP